MHLYKGILQNGAATRIKRVHLYKGTLQLGAWNTRGSRTGGWRKAGGGQEAERCSTTSQGHRRWRCLFPARICLAVALWSIVLQTEILLGPTSRIWSLIHKLLIGLTLRLMISSNRKKQSSIWSLLRNSTSIRKPEISRTVLFVLFWDEHYS